MLGRHRVQVIACEQIDTSTNKWYVPKKYADFRTSNIEVDITEAVEDLRIELTFDGGQPFIERLGR